MKDPIDVLKAYMKINKLNQRDLIPVIGDETIVSKIMNRKRKLNLRMIRNIHEQFGIPYELIINDYTLNN
jgi:HTH-type transcriptional regulator/antitoxin HigA